MLQLVNFMICTKYTLNGSLDFQKSTYEASKFYGFRNPLLKIYGFRGTHGTHTNASPAIGFKKKVPVCLFIFGIFSRGHDLIWEGTFIKFELFS